MENIQLCDERNEFGMLEPKHESLSPILHKVQYQDQDQKDNAFQQDPNLQVTNVKRRKWKRLRNYCNRDSDKHINLQNLEQLTKKVFIKEKTPSENQQKPFFDCIYRTENKNPITNFQQLLSACNEKEQKEINKNNENQDKMNTIKPSNKGQNVKKKYYFKLRELFHKYDKQQDEIKQSQEKKLNQKQEIFCTLFEKEDFRPKMNSDTKHNKLKEIIPNNNKNDFGQDGNEVQNLERKMSDLLIDYQKDMGQKSQEKQSLLQKFYSLKISNKNQKMLQYYSKKQQQQQQQQVNSDSSEESDEQIKQMKVQLVLLEKQEEAIKDKIQKLVQKKEKQGEKKNNKQNLTQ